MGHQVLTQSPNWGLCRKVTPVFLSKHVLERNFRNTLSETNNLPQQSICEWPGCLRRRRTSEESVLQIIYLIKLLMNKSNHDKHQIVQQKVHHLSLIRREVSYSISLLSRSKSPTSISLEATSWTTTIIVIL